MVLIALCNGVNGTLFYVTIWFVMIVTSAVVSGVPKSAWPYRSLLRRVLRTLKLFVVRIPEIFYIY